VEKVFSILEVLAASKAGLAAHELVARCGLPKSSVHCILVTLQRCGYLHRNVRTGRYLLGTKLLRLANSALSSLDLRQQAEPHMQALARRAGLTVHLGMVESSEAVVVAKVDHFASRRLLGSWVGKRMDLHCTAIGKSLIAEWSKPELESLAKKLNLCRHNDNTISSLTRLNNELARVRRLGYAVDDEEDVLGFRCVGVPVRDPADEVIAAMSISGTVHEITLDNISSIAAEVQLAARGLSKSLTTVSPFFRPALEIRDPNR
jgi:DNA-binding IclR family transcriptional regulator